MVWKISLFLFLATALAHGENITLKIGEEKRWPLPPQRRIWIQDRKVLDVVPQGAHLILRGHAEGQTVVELGDRTFQIQVVNPLKKTLFKAFDKALPQLLGLRLKTNKHQVQVDGKLYLWENWLRLAEISRSLDASYVMSAEIPTNLQNQARNYWQKSFENQGLTPLPIQFGHPLHSEVNIPADVYAKYQEILGPFGVVLEKNSNALNLAPVVRVQITVAEVRRDLTTKYGLKWPSTYSATVLSNGQNEFAEMMFTAQALEQQGQGKILASPSLLCRSGKEAEFLAGGEFPIKVMTSKVQSVIWKKYGVMLKVRPSADSSGRMSIALETEVSTIDQSRTIDGVPGLLTNRISSHFDLAKAQTIALSGLIKNEDGQASEGIPLLSRLPVLGALFSSKDFRENRTELVILVRPEVVREDTSLTQNNPGKHLGDVSHD